MHAAELVADRRRAGRDRRARWCGDEAGRRPASPSSSPHRRGWWRGRPPWPRCRTPSSSRATPPPTTVTATPTEPMPVPPAPAVLLAWTPGGLDPAARRGRVGRPSGHRLVRRGGAPRSISSRPTMRRAVWWTPPIPGGPSRSTPWRSIPSPTRRSPPDRIGPRSRASRRTERCSGPPPRSSAGSARAVRSPWRAGIGSPSRRSWPTRRSAALRWRSTGRPETGSASPPTATSSWRTRATGRRSRAPFAPRCRPTVRSGSGRPGEAPFLRHGDAVLPQALVKQRFGEFAYRPGSGDEFTQDPAWQAEHLVDVDLPIIGRSRCHQDVVPALDGALARGGRPRPRRPHRPRRVRGLLERPHDPAGRRSVASRVGRGRRPQRGANPTGLASVQDPRLVAIFARWGFTEGSGWLVPDAGHFEYVSPPTG